MSAGERLLVALATLDEIDSLPRLVDAIWQAMPAADILVVDDNSPDGTGRWAQKLADEEPRLHVIHRAERLGLGTATAAAFRFAIDRDYQLLATMDADGSHDPAVLPTMYDCCRAAAEPAADCVIGSRYVPGGRIANWPRRRRIASRWVNRLSRLWLGLETQDNSSGYRMYRVDRLRQLQPESLCCRGYAYLEEVLWRLRKLGAVTREVPIEFRDRTTGQSKLGWTVALRTLWDIVGVPIRSKPSLDNHSETGKTRKNR